MIETLVSLLPVLIFLLMLSAFDSYKLIEISMVIITIIFGCTAALIVALASTEIIKYSGLSIQAYSRYLAPVIEETAKASFVFILIYKNRIGFLTDAVILGFAVGAGFALVENIIYLSILENGNLLTWIIRGFGTAIMHGGTTALLALLIQGFIDRFDKIKLSYYALPLIIAVIIHSIFNHFPLNPVLLTLLQLITLPVIVFTAFIRSENALREWMEIGWDSDIDFIKNGLSGSVSQSKIGKYLDSLKNTYSASIIADMMCYLKIRIELSIRAKGLLIGNEAGLNIKVSEEVYDNLKELEYLEDKIGNLGILTLSPLLRHSRKDLWALKYIKENNRG